jgi:hypothetical protein
MIDITHSPVSATPAHHELREGLRSSINLLYEIDKSHVNGLCRACELLPADSASSMLKGIILEEHQTLEPTRCYSLIVAAADAVEAHKVKRNITDWPFEYFWHNPVEPRHSRLLAYFIDPENVHDYGGYLLAKLFEALGLKDLPKDKWVVACETAHIDILLTRKSDDGKHAIIIENKVNGAIDQPRQLETYFEEARSLEFEVEEIYVLYLPLTKYKTPSADSLGNVPINRVRVITFEDDILRWLDAVIATPEDSPVNLCKGMRKNLEHYRDLITYLINRQKGQQMNAAILRHLEQSHGRDPLPTWNQVESLVKSAAALQECVECVIRGKLLFAIKDQLPEPASSATFYTGEGKIIMPSSPYDQLFAEEVNLGVRVTDALIVCIGVYGGERQNGIVFTGYMKRGDGEEYKRIEAVVKNKVKDQTVSSGAPLWYAYWWDKNIDYNNAPNADTAKKLATSLVAMRDEMRVLCAAPRLV